MANYQAARALLGKGRHAGEGLPSRSLGEGWSGRAFKEQRKERRQEVRGEESRRCVALVGNQLYGGRRQAKRERLGSRAPTLGMSVNHKAGTLLMH